MFAHFTTNHAKDILGAKATHIAFEKKKMSQMDINVDNHQKHLHCKYMKNTTLQNFKGIENLCKHTEFRFEDGRGPTQSSRLSYNT